MDLQTPFLSLMDWNDEGLTATNKTKGDDSSRSTSLPAIIAVFVPSFVTAVMFLSIFAVIRKYFRRIYSPRTYIDLIPEKDRTPASSSSRFEWIKTVATLGDKFILEHSSLDAYLYLRFLRTVVFICFIGSCITWPILFPVNATGGGDSSQLDKLGIGNVHGKKRLYAHAVVAWVFFGFVMFLVARERMWLIGLRQAWYLSKANASRLSSRTVLYLDPAQNNGSDSDTSRSKDRVRDWVVTSTPDLDKMVGYRNDKTMELESTQVSFLKRVNKKRSKLEPKNSNSSVGLAPETIDSLRPAHKRFYIAGEQSDAIDRLRKQVKAANSRVEVNRNPGAHGATSSRNRSAVFVEYTTQSAAQKAYRASSGSHLPLSPNLVVQSRLIGVVPKEILWSNLTMPQTTRLSRRAAANAFVIALIIFWSIPTAFIGSISNVNYLSNNFKWLRWIQDLPDPILGLMTGLIPPLLTSTLASYVPDILRYIAKVSGEPTTVSAELQVQSWYYAFQIIQVFFVTALSSSATAFIPQIIKQPHAVPMLLADNLPKSSNFYLTYFILQGLGSSAKNVLNYSDLFQYLFYDWFVNKTPRAKYDQYTSLKGIGWGKLYPKFTNFVVIALAYSCISPLVLGFATIGLSLFYLAYRHNLLFVVQPKMDTKGKCYTRALQQILTGIYVGELCLIGLFGLRKATGPSIMTGALFFATIAYNVVTNRYLSPLEDRFPDELIAAEGEEEPLLAAEEGHATEEADEHSRVQRIGHDLRVPQKVIDPIARFFEPHIYASHKVVKAAFNIEDSDELQYSEDDLRNAYRNPSLTSKTPKIWLPADEMGLSKKEIEANVAEGLETTHDGAELDEKAQVQFEKHNLRSLPVWKKPPPY